MLQEVNLDVENITKTLIGARSIPRSSGPPPPKRDNPPVVKRDRAVELVFIFSFSLICLL